MGWLERANLIQTLAKTAFFAGALRRNRQGGGPAREEEPGPGCVARAVKGDGMNPTETLKHEHQIVLLVLKGAEREARSIQAGDGAHVEEIEQMVDFFRTFVDRCHHGKEERHLFPAMHGKGMPLDAGPLAVMLHEHELGRGAVRAIVEALERVKRGEAAAGSDLASALLGYVEASAQPHLQGGQRPLPDGGPHPAGRGAGRPCGALRQGRGGGDRARGPREVSRVGPPTRPRLRRRGPRGDGARGP